EQEATPVIPSKKNRRVQRKWDKAIYKERHLVKCFFNKTKHYRRLATRFDKLTCTFQGFFDVGLDYDLACLGLNTRPSLMRAFASIFPNSIFRAFELLNISVHAY
ncbi:hypothetical protein ACWGOO_10155, partial [Paenibacillus sp. NPDC055715]